MADRPLALVTGASTGIGYELAVQCAKNGIDLIIAADESAINEAARQIQSLGSSVVPVQADLATLAGVEQLLAALGTRPVDALPANAGRRLGKGFLDPRIPHKPFDQGSARGQQPRLPLRQPNTAARLV